MEHRQLLKGKTHLGGRGCLHECLVLNRHIQIEEISCTVSGAVVATNAKRVALPRKPWNVTDSCVFPVRHHIFDSNCSCLSYHELLPMLCSSTSGYPISIPWHIRTRPSLWHVTVIPTCRYLSAANCWHYSMWPEIRLPWHFPDGSRKMVETKRRLNGFYPFLQVGYFVIDRLIPGGNRMWQGRKQME